MKHISILPFSISIFIILGIMLLTLSQKSTLSSQMYDVLIITCGVLFIAVIGFLLFKIKQQ